MVILYLNVDTYKLINDQNDKWIDINETGIANKYDMDVMYLRHPNHTRIQWMDMKNGITINN